MNECSESLQKENLVTGDETFARRSTQSLGAQAGWAHRGELMSLLFGRGKNQLHPFIFASSKVTWRTQHKEPAAEVP